MAKNNSKWNRFSCASLCYMLATEYLWMSTYECITIGGLLSTCMPTFHSHLEITALPHTNTSFSILRQPCFFSLASHNPSILIIEYFVNYCKLCYIKGCEIICDWMASVPMHCPFIKPSMLQLEVCCMI